MQTFDQDLIALWHRGRISEEEALRHADSYNDMRLKIKMAKLEGSDEGSHLDQLSHGVELDLDKHEEF